MSKANAAVLFANAASHVLAAITAFRSAANGECGEAISDLERIHELCIRRADMASKADAPSTPKVDAPKVKADAPPVPVAVPTREEFYAVAAEVFGKAWDQFKLENRLSAYALFLVSGLSLREYSNSDKAQRTAIRESKAAEHLAKYTELAAAAAIPVAPAAPVVDSPKPVVAANDGTPGIATSKGKAKAKAKAKAKGKAKGEGLAAYHALRAEAKSLGVVTVKGMNSDALKAAIVAAKSKPVADIKPQTVAPKQDAQSAPKPVAKTADHDRLSVMANKLGVSVSDILAAAELAGIRLS